MVSIISLWLPILLSAVFVFAASSIIHMLFTYHRNDFIKVPEEDQVMEELRKFKIPPGDYAIPCAGSPKAMKSPEFIEKYTKGPVAFMTVIPSGSPSMVKSLVLWFIYIIVVGIFTAYITGRTVGADAHYLTVFRIAGCAAFMGYALGLWQYSIWFHRSWISTIKSTFDGLIYALLTAGTFGWLWAG